MHRSQNSKDPGRKGLDVLEGLWCPSVGSQSIVGTHASGQGITTELILGTEMVVVVVTSQKAMEHAAQTGRMGFLLQSDGKLDRL